MFGLLNTCETSIINYIKHLTLEAPLTRESIQIALPNYFLAGLVGGERDPQHTKANHF